MAHVGKADLRLDLALVMQSDGNPVPYCNGGHVHWCRCGPNHR
ncbi:MAG: hypothetical protein ACP5NF_06805 [Thermoanaerobaculum sp.]